jgi:peroxiredoxin Q/BCP
MITMTLQIGAKAPDFTLPATTGENVTLSKLKKQPVVVYFYPRDDTPGCTKEACDFRDNLERLKAYGVTVLGISKDNLFSHQKFKDKFSLNFPLLSDESSETIQAYGAWAEKSMFGKKYMGIERMTFLIDKNGAIAKIWPKVNVEGHVDEILEEVAKLGSSRAA